MLRQVTPTALLDEAYTGTRTEYLTQYTAESLRNARCFLSEDGTTGCAIMDNGRLTLLFNKGPFGQGKATLAEAVQLGATRLSCFDGFLPGYYAKHGGFQEVRRDAFDEAHAPEGWNYRTNGRPDVVTMELYRGY